jgi:hypothetical protein
MATDRRELCYLLTAWGCYWRELADRLGSTGPSSIVAFREGHGARQPGSRLPAPAHLLAQLPEPVRRIEGAVAILCDQGYVSEMRVIGHEYIAPKRRQYQTAQQAGLSYRRYLYLLRQGRRRLSIILSEIPIHRAAMVANR